jgi:hypothetical protein
MTDNRQPPKQPGLVIDLLAIDAAAGENWLAGIRAQGRQKRRAEMRQAIIAKRKAARSVQESAATGTVAPKPGFTGVDSHGHKWVAGKQVKINQDQPAAQKPSQSDQPSPSGQPKPAEPPKPGQQQGQLAEGQPAKPQASLYGKPAEVVSRDSSHGLVRVKVGGREQVVKVKELTFPEEPAKTEQTKPEPEQKPPAEPKQSEPSGQGDSIAVGESLKQVYDYLHHKAASGFAKLPQPIQTVVAKTISIAFSAWTKSQDLAEEIALENGATPDEAVKMRSVFAAWDIALFKPMAVAAGSMGALASAATWIIPPVTGAYLAYSAVRHPLSTYRAAKNMIHDAADDTVRSAKKFLKEHHSDLGESAESQSETPTDDQKRLANALITHKYDDWYSALLHAALETTQDVAAGIALADKVFSVHGKDESQPADDDADVVLGKEEGDEADFSEDDIRLLEELTERRVARKAKRQLREGAELGQQLFTGIITDKIGRRRKFVNGEPVPLDEEGPQAKAPIARYKGQKVKVIAKEDKLGLARVVSASGEAVVKETELDFREPGPSPKKYGKSKAEISVRASDAEIKPYLEKIFPGMDRDAAADVMAHCVGAPDDAKVFVLIANGELTISVKHPNIKNCERTFGIDEQGRRYIHNELLRVQKPGGGFGTELLAKQVENAAENGFSYILTTAGGNYRAVNPDGSFQKDMMTGYYTWPQTGYDQDLDKIELRAPVEKELKEKFPDAKTIRDVTDSPGGKEWWKMNGQQIDDMVFDLSEDSMSRQMLAEYIEEHDKKRAARAAKGSA